jgi:cob(I)alamin adenosyltransferase
MRIYTKTGDRGETGLIDGSRVSKDEARVVAYGEIDELQAQLGLIRAEIDASAAAPPAARAALENGAPTDPSPLLRTIQKDLFSLSARLADPKDRIAERKEKVVTGDDRILALEREIDAREEALPPLRAFILAGGSPRGARLHLARTVCRRAERAVVKLMRATPVDPVLVAYLNRLSDLLFVMARYENQRAGVLEDTW